MISCDIQPFSILDDPGFLQYLFTLDLKFLAASRNTIENDVSSLFEEKKKQKLLTLFKIKYLVFVSLLIFGPQDIRRGTQV